MFDLFMDYWTRKKKDPNTHLNCINKETYYEIIVGEDKIPMPASYIPFPDLVEVYIAEIMLGRELTDLEKEGSRFIPKINILSDYHKERDKWSRQKVIIKDHHSIDSNGVVKYFAPLTWITYPHSYMTTPNGSVVTNYNDPPLPKLFDIDEIRGLYKDRPGGVCDV